MLKKFSTILLILFFTLNSFILVKADTPNPNSTQTVNKVTVKANINNFNGEIFFFINDSKDKKRVFVLNKRNSYSTTYELPTGDSKILDIKFFDQNNNQVTASYNYNGTLNTTADKEAIFTINVNGILTDQNSTDQNSTNQNVTEQNSANQNVADKNVTNKNVIDKNSTNKNVTIKTSTGTIINLIIDFILIAVVGGIALFIKYKEKRRK